MDDTRNRQSLLDVGGNIGRSRTSDAASPRERIRFLDTILTRNSFRSRRPMSRFSFWAIDITYNLTARRTWNIYGSHIETRKSKHTRHRMWFTRNIRHIYISYHISLDPRWRKSRKSMRPRFLSVLPTWSILYLSMIASLKIHQIISRISNSENHPVQYFCERNEILKTKLLSASNRQYRICCNE